MPFNYKSEFDRYRRYYLDIGEAVRRPKPQAYTTAIFSFLAVSLFGWYAIRPTLQTILFLEREIADNKVVSQQMEDKIDKLIEAQSTYQKIQNNLPLLSEALSDNPNTVDVVSQLRNLGNLSGASISALTVSTIPLVAGVATSAATQNPVQVPPSSGRNLLSTRKTVDIPISVTLRGFYASIQTFLDGVTHMRRIITVENISLVPDTEGRVGATGDVPLRMIVKLTAHYLE